MQLPLIFNFLASSFAKNSAALLLCTLHSPFSILHSPLSTLHSPLSTLHSPLSTLHSPFPIPHSPFPIPHSVFGIRHLRFATRHSPRFSRPRIVGICDECEFKSTLRR